MFWHRISLRNGKEGLSGTLQHRGENISRGQDRRGGKEMKDKGMIGFLQKGLSKLVEMHHSVCLEKRSRDKSSVRSFDLFVCLFSSLSEEGFEKDERQREGNGGKTHSDAVIRLGGLNGALRKHPNVRKIQKTKSRIQ